MDERIDSLRLIFDQAKFMVTAGLFFLLTLLMSCGFVGI